MTETKFDKIMWLVLILTFFVSVYLARVWPIRWMGLGIISVGISGIRAAAPMHWDPVAGTLTFEAVDEGTQKFLPVPIRKKS